MSRIAQPAFVGAVGFDCVTPITPGLGVRLADAGMRFAVRYLGSVTSQEIDAVLAAGMAIMPVTYSRAPGWQPGAVVGAEDGDRAVLHLSAAGFPKGVTVWLDLEGAVGTALQVSAWANAWASKVKAAGYDPGLYVGAGCILNSKELFALPLIDRYWNSLSRETDAAGQIAEPSCGWCMIQLYPTVKRAGFPVDLDVVQQDYQNRLPVWCTSLTAPSLAFDNGSDEAA